MSTILSTLLVPAVASTASSSSSSTSSIISSSLLRRSSIIADTAKRRTIIAVGNNNPLAQQHVRWDKMAFAWPSQSSRYFTTTTTNNNNNNNRSNNSSNRGRNQLISKPVKLPWTPICETSTTLMMTNNKNNINSEGFRDAHRGGQQYIRSPDDDNQNNNNNNNIVETSGGGSGGEGSMDAVIVSEGSEQQLQQQQQLQHLYQQRSPPPQSNSSEQTTASTPPTITGGKGYGFPKVTPGRQRNYKSPHASAHSALQQSYRRKNVVSSLERVSLRELQQQQGQGNQQQGNNGEMASGGTEQTTSPPPAVMQNNNDINGAATSSSSSSILVEPSPGENFRNDPQRFKASGSDGSNALQLELSSGNLGPNGALSAVDSSQQQQQQDQQPQTTLISGSGVNTASTTTSTTVSTTYSTTTSSTTNINNSNNNNDPFRGKGTQYYERAGPQSMNFRDGSRMAMFKDDAFRVAANAAAAAERDFHDDNLIMDDEEMLMNNRTKVASSAEGIATTTTTDDKQPNRSNSNNIINSGTSELSLDPKLIDFLPSDQVKEEEDLLDYNDNDVVNQGGEGAEPYISTQLLKTRLHDLLEDTELGGFVKMFRGSASYIANHRGTIAVYHIPGELLAWEGFPGLMDDIALTWLLGMKIVLVAGCRHQIDLRLEEEDGESDDDEDDRGYSGKVMMSSIRVTDEDTLRVVKEEAGFVRFEIERRLAKSLRLHGGLVKGSESLVGNVVSGNFYSAQPFGVIDGIDYCWTGFPRKVEVERIRQVHETNDIVLLTSLGVSPSGEIFNVNSEFLAATVAGAVSASKIVYFNVHGTSFQNKNTNKPVQNLRVSDAKNLLTHYNMKIHPKGFALVDLAGNSPQQQVLRTPGSMETLIKVGYSMVALEKGVKRAHILAPENGALVQELYTRDGCGTLISRDIYEGIRRADVNDVSGIYDLIDPLVRAGTLVPRPKSKLEKEITGYYVYTRDGLIVATGQLKRFEGGFAEIGCLVVNKDYRKGGRGDAMLGYLERLSLQCGAKKVFVLSTQTMDWFIERGFKEVSVESLPPSRQAMYNKKRKSKIYMKEIDGERDLDAAELWWSNQVSS